MSRRGFSWRCFTRSTRHELAELCTRETVWAHQRWPGRGHSRSSMTTHRLVCGGNALIAELSCKHAPAWAFAQCITRCLLTGWRHPRLGGIAIWAGLVAVAHRQWQRGCNAKQKAGAVQRSMVEQESRCCGPHSGMIMLSSVPHWPGAPT
ncbi:hypothetical protein DE146DRAFT_665938 [Phaeosphaeria sp. MPI-PUGE-AT-0046c]|nr:hypothetical protein DE146DRAFT_665938 [Phaeosphaeria sp. MPI-PUGE-AT-0046c]